MSLIPSESYSFPDHFTSTVTPSRNPKEEKPGRGTAEKLGKRPSIVALPDPEPVLSEPETIPEESPVEPAPLAPPTVEPVRSKVMLPNPALRRVNAPPPRIPEPLVRKSPVPPTLKPKMRWNNRAATVDPSTLGNHVNGSADAVRELPVQNVIPMRAVKLQPPPPRPAPRAPIMQEAAQLPPVKSIPVAAQARLTQVQPLPQKPRPAAVPSPQADFFEMFDESGQMAAIKQRRKLKFRRFIVCEAGALAVLLPLVVLGLALNISAPALRWIMNIFTIAAAVAAAVIPIVFYAFTPTLPELER
jgi:hypothetical protein